MNFSPSRDTRGSLNELSIYCLGLVPPYAADLVDRQAVMYIADDLAV
jgi:hypothetical protein